MSIITLKKAENGYAFAMPSLGYIKDYALDPVLCAMSTDGSVMFCVHLGVSEI